MYVREPIMCSWVNMRMSVTDRSRNCYRLTEKGKLVLVQLQKIPT
jgi:predicted transcriptional regulator